MAAEVITAQIVLSNASLSSLFSLNNFAHPEKFSILHNFTNQVCGELTMVMSEESLPSIDVKNFSVKRSLGAPQFVNPVKKPKVQFNGAVNVGVKPSNVNLHSVEQIQTWKDVVSSEGKLFLCNSCVYRTNKLSNIKRHSTTHEENCPKLKCLQCGAELRGKASLKGHYVKVHQFTENVAKAAVEDSREVV